MFFSPKRSKRDGKPEEEEEGVLLSKKDLDVRDGCTETDKKPRQSLRDAAPLEPDAQGLRKDVEKKLSDTTKQAPHLSEELRSTPYHQVSEALFIVFHLIVITINQVYGIFVSPHCCQLKRLKLLI